MLDKTIGRNLWNGRFFWGAFLGVNLVCMKIFEHRMYRNEIFGLDGNGGDMLKIITDLTDEEIARLKFVRRTTWHWKGMHKGDQGPNENIQVQELADREIDWPVEPYIEYVKRPPHDKYL
jgi:hypothetical protein